MRRWISAAAVAALLALATIGVAPRASGENAPIKIGVINIKKVFGIYTKAKEFEDGLEEEAKDEKAYMDRMEKELADLRTDIEQLKEGGALRKEKIEKFVSLQALAKFRVEDWNNRTKERLNSNTAKIYNEIRDEVDGYAKEKGYTLILKTEEGRLDDASNESANQRVNRRTVVYSTPDMDISEDIGKRLNAKYAEVKKSGGGNPPGKGAGTDKNDKGGGS